MADWWVKLRDTTSKVTWPCNCVATPHEVTWQIKKRYISTSPKALTAKLGKVEIYNKRSPSMKSFESLSSWSSDHVADKKRYISTSARTMAKKPDRVVDSKAGLLSTKPHNLLITWSHKVIKQMQNVINLFLRDLWLSNFTEGWLMIKSHVSNNNVTHPSDQVVTWSHETNQLHDIFILWSLMPLNLTGWWLVKLKSRRLFN